MRLPMARCRTRCNRRAALPGLGEVHELLAVLLAHLALPAVDGWRWARLSPQNVALPAAVIFAFAALILGACCRGQRTGQQERACCPNNTLFICIAFCPQ
jgi:hypothetical protein